MTYKAKERVYLAKDHKTLVAAGSPDAATLFAAEGASVPDSKVDGLSGVAKFFAKEGAREETQSHNAPQASTRVVENPQPAKGRAPKVKRAR